MFAHVYLRSFALAASGVVAALAVPACAAQAPRSGEEVVEVRLPLANANLETAQGRADFEHRIDLAAKEACADLAEQPGAAAPHRFRQCYQAAHADAQRQLALVLDHARLARR